MTDISIRKVGDWLIDANNNACSIEYWGSEEEARAALASLVRCTGCTDCAGCAGCTGCVDRNGACRQTGKRGGFVVPIIPELHQKVAAAVTADAAALEMSAWHTCETTHCRAGWIVHIAGEAGRELERQTTTAFAAMQIAKASGMPISPTRFFDTNEAAMKDILAMAEKEKAGE